MPPRKRVVRTHMADHSMHVGPARGISDVAMQGRDTGTCGFQSEVLRPTAGKWLTTTGLAVTHLRERVDAFGSLVHLLARCCHLNCC
jgi:hypothetical protein